MYSKWIFGGNRIERAVFQQHRQIMIFRFGWLRAKEEISKTFLLPTITVVLLYGTGTVQYCKGTFQFDTARYERDYQSR